MTTPEPCVGNSDDNDAEVYARNSESCGNEELDLPTFEQGMWKDLNGVHHGPVATVYVLEHERYVLLAGLLRAAPSFCPRRTTRRPLPASAELEVRGRDQRFACVSYGRLPNEPRRYDGLSVRTEDTVEELRI
ncbi:hypothetical protein MRX96_032878 [Rhipicephalus microplus]